MCGSAFIHDLNKLLTPVEAESSITQGFPITERHRAITRVAKWATDLQHVSRVQRNSMSAGTTSDIMFLLFSQLFSVKSSK